MERKWIITIIAGLIVTTITINQVSSCPPDIAKHAQKCFTDLATGVASDPDNSGIDISDSINDNGADEGEDGKEGDSTQQTTHSVKGTMPLDYRKIREYCAEDGHMNRFVQCVENLLDQCPHLPQEGALRQLINPQRVRTSVPNLCNNVDMVEAGADCMNREMNRRSPCKDRAYTMVKSGMLRTASNISAMFDVQCRFFSLLAECQRKAVSDQCGGNLGDLHADFMLSFVPNTCSKGASDDLPPELGEGDLDLVDSKGQIKDPLQSDRNMLPDLDANYEKPPEEPSEGHSMGHGDLLHDDVKMPKRRNLPLTQAAAASASKEEEPMEQVLQTLPPATTPTGSGLEEVTSQTQGKENPSSQRPPNAVIGSSVAAAPPCGIYILIVSLFATAVISFIVTDK